jgi:hypothetical protein
MQVIFDEFFPEQLAKCKVGDRCKFWLHPSGLSIYVYRPRSLGGQGLIAALSIDENPKLAARLEDGEDLRLILTSTSGGRYAFDAVKID